MHNFFEILYSTVTSKWVHPHVCYLTLIKWIVHQTRLKPGLLEKFFIANSKALYVLQHVFCLLCVQSCRLDCNFSFCCMYKTSKWVQFSPSSFKYGFFKIKNLFLYEWTSDQLNISWTFLSSKLDPPVIKTWERHS